MLKSIKFLPQKAKLSYLKDGFLVYETVSVEEDQVDFESEEGVSVIFDYNKVNVHKCLHLTATDRV